MTTPTVTTPATSVPFVSLYHQRLLAKQQDISQKIQEKDTPMNVKQDNPVEFHSLTMIAASPAAAPVMQKVGIFKEDLSQDKFIDHVNLKFIPTINHLVSKFKPEYKVPVRTLLPDEGVCSGLTLVWLFYMNRNEENKFFNIIRFIIKASSYQLLVERKLVERFVAMVEVGQNPGIYAVNATTMNIFMIFSLFNLLFFSDNPFEILALLAKQRVSDHCQDYLKKRAILMEKSNTVIIPASLKELSLILQNKNLNQVNSFVIGNQVHCIGFFAGIICIMLWIVMKKQIAQ